MPLRSRLALTIACMVAFCTAPTRAQAAPPRLPNVIFILADDIGYGDLGCYGATKHRTPHCDRLAREGVRFTDGHAPSAVCTPTRYAFMTGEYAWRKPNTGILSGEAGLIIEPGRTTIASLLKRAGYATGVVGKWHLGLGTQPTDYNAEIRPGPLDIGFDEAWLLPATGDRTPCVWVEGRRVVGLDPADPIKLDYSVQRGEPRSFVAGIPRIGSQAGGRAAIWKDEEMADMIAAKGVDFVERHRAGPFFLYFNTHDIHVPRVPHPRFKGTSDTGVRGDAVHSFDWTVGRILEALDRLAIADDTLVILTSDNGGTLDNNGPDEEHGIGSPTANDGHAHNGPLREGKGSVYEGGTRVPFIVRWPARVKPGTSDALVSHVDMLASLAALVGQPLAEADGPDSIDVTPALLDGGPGRTDLVEHGRGLALRMGTWKYIPARTGKRAGARPPELYDLAVDISETTNLVREKPEIAARMEQRLTEIETAGRSRLAGSAAKEPGRPNVVVIVADDLGYADVGFHGCRDIPTPHLDALAARGAVCTNGYVSGPYCSPTRAGLMTGRYQQRFGHEFNSGGPGGGLPVSETTLADRLRAAGYATCAVGKWHLGEKPEFHPLARGFDDFFGFLGGGHTYFPRRGGIQRGREAVAEAAYLTDAFGREACGFLDRVGDRPFFLYLAFNAVHTPLEADAERLAKLAGIADPKRRTYAAMLSALDDNVGRVLTTLEDRGLDENTLVCFISDNGGPVMPGTTMNGSSNAPLRGSKRQTLEGGVRVPFVVSWPGRIPAGRRAEPVIQLDIAPTVLAAAGIEAAEAAFDGVNLLPWLSGSDRTPPHDTLFWRFGEQMAIRRGEWKLVRWGTNETTLPGERWPKLYRLSSDVGESRDLAAAEPAKVAELEAAWQAWNRELPPPRGRSGEQPIGGRNPGRKRRQPVGS